MKAHSDALRRRWSDPAYRERQTAANRRAAAERQAAFADPLVKLQHGMAVRVGYRVKKKVTR